MCGFVAWTVFTKLSLPPSLFTLEFHLERTPLLTSAHPPELAGQFLLASPRYIRYNNNNNNFKKKLNGGIIDSTFASKFAKNVITNAMQH